MLFTDQNKKIFISWEWLRIPYNILLLLVGFVGCIPLYVHGQMPLWEIIFGAIIYGAMANIGYMLGPLFEVYLEWLGCNKKPYIRIVLFMVGVAFSLFTTYVVLAIVYLETGSHFGLVYLNLVI